MCDIAKDTQSWRQMILISTRRHEEQLKSIEQIGDKRAQLIIKARTSKGRLTLSDLKMMTAIPSTIWDPLVKTGDITVDADEEEHELDEGRLGKLQAMLEDMAGTIGKLQIENRELKQHHDTKLEETRAEFLGQLWEKDQYIKQLVDKKEMLQKMEMMAPGGVYGHQISRPMFPFRSSEPQKTSLEENFSSNELGSCPKSNTDENISKMVGPGTQGEKIWAGGHMTTKASESNCLHLMENLNGSHTSCSSTI